MSLNVLFVCTGNTCRSPMAEGTFKKMCREEGLEVSVSSAGLFAEEGAPASENAVISCEECGADISSHRARSLTRETAHSADIIVPMSVSHIYGLSTIGVSEDKIFFTADIPDPYGGDITAYRRCLEGIKEVCRALCDRIKNDED